VSRVDGAGFKQLMSYLEPGYKVPSCSHITSICCKKFDAMKEQLLATLATVQYVAVTTDIWTSRAMQAFITVTVHFLTDCWKMESNVLQTQEMPERHTGVHISERLLIVIKACIALLVQIFDHDNNVKWRKDRKSVSALLMACTRT